MRDMEKKPYCITGEEVFNELEQKAIMSLTEAGWTNRDISTLLNTNVNRVIMFKNRHKDDNRFDLNKLSNRARHCLVNQGYKDRNEFISRIANDPFYVHRIPNCGKRTREEIYEWLEFKP